MGTGLRTPVGQQLPVGSTHSHRIAKSAFGTPGYVTSDPMFGFCNFTHDTTGVELVGGVGITVNAFKLFANGTWYGSTDVPKVVTPGAGVLMGGFAGVSLPANAMVYWVIEFEFASMGAGVNSVTLSGNPYWNGGEIWASDTSQGFTSLAAANASGLLPPNGAGTAPNWGNDGTGFFWGPSMCFAKGGDGRPAVIIPGDSIGYGQWQDNQVGSWSPRREFGYVNLGLDSVASSSKRLGYLNLCVPGQSPSDWTNRSFWSRKLDLVKQVTDLQGQAPFDIVLCQHGENSCTSAKALASTTMPAWYNFLKAEWPGKPVHQIELLPRSTSSDSYRTIANQSCDVNMSPGDGVTDANLKARDSYNDGNPAGMGDRWLFNTACAPGGALRTGGYIAASIPAWQYGSHDAGANRDLLAVRPFTTTTTGPYNGGTGRIPLAAAATPGMHLAVSSSGGYVGANRVFGAGNLDVEIIQNTFSSGSVAAGNAVWELPHDTGGVHPSGVMHGVYSAAIVDWKVQQGWV